MVDAGHGQDVQDDVGDADEEHGGAEEDQSGWTVVDPTQSRFTFTMITVKMDELYDAKKIQFSVDNDGYHAMILL